jgi:hypothetical protein
MEMYRTLETTEGLHLPKCAISALSSNAKSAILRNTTVYEPFIFPMKIVLESAENNSDFPFYLTSNCIRPSIPYISTTGATGIAYIPAAPASISPNYVIYDIMDRFDANYFKQFENVISYDSVESLIAGGTLTSSNNDGKVRLGTASAAGKEYLSMTRMNEPRDSYIEVTGPAMISFRDHLRSKLLLYWTPRIINLETQDSCSLLFDVTNPNEAITQNEIVPAMSAGFSTNAVQQTFMQTSSIRVSATFNMLYYTISKPSS